MAFSNHDIVSDSPTNNFATLNPLVGTSNGTFDDGNLKITSTAFGGMNGGSTISIPHTGKWYVEFFVASLIAISKDFTATDWGTSYGLNEEGRIYINATDTTGTSTGRSWSTGDIISLLIDSSASSNNLSFYKNGTTSNDLIHQATYDLTTANFFVLIHKYYTYNSYINFGNDHTFGGSKSPTTTYTDANGIGAFYYQPPTGALALCSANLPDFTPTVNDDTPQDYFKAVTYTGQTVGGAMTAWDGTTGTIECGFPVDLAWIKVRNAAGGHRLYDTIRGANQILTSNETSEERTFADEVTGFHSTGFYVGNASIGGAGGNYVAWCWKAGGAPSADDKAMVDGVESTITNDPKLDAGTITPTRMSVNTKAGFSIVKYVGDQGTGSTVPHGLLQVPQIVLVKPLNGTTTYGWRMYTEMTGNTKYLQLNSTAQAATYTDWNSTSPTTNVFTVNSSAPQTNNENGTSYIAYCWHSVEGYSKFGSYTGNGSDDGPFGYTDFRPAFVMIKRTDAAGYFWVIFDEKRVGYNPSNWTLAPNSSNAESEGGNGAIDLLSNGFKCRDTDSGTNASGGTYIFMAFAEQPFIYSNAR